MAPRGNTRKCPQFNISTISAYSLQQGGACVRDQRRSAEGDGGGRAGRGSEEPSGDGVRPHLPPAEAHHRGELPAPGEACPAFTV